MFLSCSVSHFSHSLFLCCRRIKAKAYLYEKVQLEVNMRHVQKIETLAKTWACKYKQKPFVCLVSSVMAKKHQAEHISQEFIFHNTYPNFFLERIRFSFRHISNKPLLVFMLFATEGPHLSG